MTSHVKELLRYRILNKQKLQQQEQQQNQDEAALHFAPSSMEEEELPLPKELLVQADLDGPTSLENLSIAVDTSSFLPEVNFIVIFWIVDLQMDPEIEYKFMTGQIRSIGDIANALKEQEVTKDNCTKKRRAYSTSEKVKKEKKLSARRTKLNQTE